MEDEIRDVNELKVEKGKGGEIQKKDQEEEEEVEDDDSMEWELRNTDSLFSELSELSRDYVESVDRGASVRGEYQSVDAFGRRAVTHSLINGVHFHFISDRSLFI